MSEIRVIHEVDPATWEGYLQYLDNLVSPPDPAVVEPVEEPEPAPEPVALSSTLWPEPDQVPPPLPHRHHHAYDDQPRRRQPVACWMERQEQAAEDGEEAEELHRTAARSASACGLSASIVRSFCSKDRCAEGEGGGGGLTPDCAHSVCRIRHDEFELGGGSLTIPAQSAK